MPRPGAGQYRSLKDALSSAIGGSGSVSAPIMLDYDATPHLAKGRGYLANHASRDRRDLTAGYAAVDQVDDLL